MLEGSRTTVLIWAAAAVLATLAAMRLFGGDGSAAPAVRINGGPAAPGGGQDVGRGAEGAGAHRTGSKQAAAHRLYVHVAGAVRRPGLYRVGSDARVAAALARAGGPRPGADLAAVNLAATVQDGQQILVPKVGATPGLPATGSAGGADAGAAAPKISLATATTEQLEELDGIGPTLAERIVEYREEQGGFRSLGELREVDGIGEKRFASLEEALQP